MATAQIGHILGIPFAFTNANKQLVNFNGSGVTTDANGKQFFGGINWGNYITIALARARLAVIDAGFYTASKLDAMTFNDMIYAGRVVDFPTSIK